MTSVQIPCCVCGGLIYPNAANQCGSCLAHDVDLSTLLQQGPGGADHPTIHQCRQCRRYQQTPKHYIYAEPESPELLALCLKHIPALQHGSHLHHSPIRIVDASWVWTEPHSMRYKLRITAQTQVQNVPVQQRVVVELHCTFQMCPDCNREYTNRTWHAVLQVRQRHSTKGMRSLEMALAKPNAAIVRQHVIKLDSTSAGLDFYFLQLRQAQQLAQFIATIYPCRIKTTQKLVSEDTTNNTANMKYTVSCELLPLAKDDLIVLGRTVPSPLAGRVALVTKVSANLIQCVDAVTMEHVDITADLYYRYEKFIRVLHVSTVRAIVLDVVVVQARAVATAPRQQPPSAPHRHSKKQQQQQQQQQPPQSPSLLHEVQLWFGGGGDDTTVTVVTHVGQYLTAGDTVLLYDLRNSTVPIDEDWFHHAYQLPDVVVMKKTKPDEKDQDDAYDTIDQGVTTAPEEESTTPLGTHNNGSDDSDDDDNQNNDNDNHQKKKKLSKKKERRRRKDHRRMRDLEERAARMGFIDNHDDVVDEYDVDEYIGDGDNQKEDRKGGEGGDSFVVPDEMAKEVAALEGDLLLVDRSGEVTTY
jgi:nonsense-mediated mRNA decay protein 3